MHRTLQGPGERHAGLWIRPCRACYVQHHSTICTPSATQRLEPPWHAIAMRCVRLALQLCRSALAVSQPYSPRTPLTFPHVSMHIRGGYGAEEQEFCGSAERGVISVVLYHSTLAPAAVSWMYCTITVSAILSAPFCHGSACQARIITVQYIAHRTYSMAGQGNGQSKIPTKYHIW